MGHPNLREINETPELDAEGKLFVVNLMYASAQETISVLNGLHEAGERKIAELEAEVQRLVYRLEAAYDEIDELRGLSDDDAYELDYDYPYTGAPYGGF